MRNGLESQKSPQQSGYFAGSSGEVVGHFGGVEIARRQRGPRGVHLEFTLMIDQSTRLGSGRGRCAAKRLLIGIALLAATFIVVVALQPDDYRLTRQTVIAALRSRVRPSERPAEMGELVALGEARSERQGDFSARGPARALSRWDGNDKVGAGTMTITESKPNLRVATRTDFVKPFEGTSNSDHLLRSRRSDQRDLDHDGQAELRRQGDLPVHEHGADARPGLRRGLAQLKQAAEANSAYSAAIGSATCASIAASALARLSPSGSSSAAVRAEAIASMPARKGMRPSSTGAITRASIVV